METSKYVRKSFDVEAVRVTEENIDEVAQWCGGTIEAPHALSLEEAKHIKVRVRYPINERQTKAFVGDWVLNSGRGFKVYTDNAFNKQFVSSDPTPEQVSDEAVEKLRNIFNNTDEKIPYSAVSDQDSITGKR